ncbi:MAG: hypothetical protein GX488_02795, partial [Clostridiales bacterium]|nr:hypothetical protein [Clostridiales bacterium]
LIDMGLSQKQAVAILYSISGILGLAAVIITTSGEIKALILILGFCLCAFLWAFVYGKLHKSEITPETAIKGIAAAGSEISTEFMDIPANKKTLKANESLEGKNNAD